ncbi:MAG: hypothetical protein ACK4MT_01495, partial [Thermaurantiacus tibetensis]
MSGADAPLPPLQRHVRGGRPGFHADPAIDRLIRMVLTLAGEVSVLADRLATVEALAGLDPGAIDAHRPDAAETARREARREASGWVGRRGALLVPQGLDGVHLRGPHRRVDAEHHPHQHGDAEG